MQFNTTASTAAVGLIQDCENLLGMTANDIAGDSVLIKRFTGDINAWYRRVNIWIWENSGAWQYDDSNQTDLPIATTTLVANQQDYEMDSEAQAVEGVSVMNAAGDYIKLTQIDKSETSLDMSELYEEAGMPTYYDLVGRSIFLYPKPAAADVTTALGLKLYFSRDIDEFTYADTTESPGFMNAFHKILSLGASMDYARSYDDTAKVSQFSQEILNIKEDLTQTYGQRDKDFKSQIKPRKENYR